MTNDKLIEKYLTKIRDTSFPEDFNTQLSLGSQLINDTINYRADIGYMWTGSWEDSIDEALGGLVRELKRVGEIAH